MMTPLSMQLGAPLVKLAILSPAVSDRETIWAKALSLLMVLVDDDEFVDRRRGGLLWGDDLNPDSPQSVGDVEVADAVSAYRNRVQNVTQVSLDALTQLPIQKQVQGEKSLGASPQQTNFLDVVQVRSLEECCPRV